MTVIIILLAVLTAVETATLTVCLLTLRHRKARKVSSDTKAAPEKNTAEKPRPGGIDEGFENIMQYAVRGRTGLEPDSERF